MRGIAFLALMLVVSCSSQSTKPPSQNNPTDGANFARPGTDPAFQGMEQLEKNDPALQGTPPSAIRPSF